jgi:heme-degrading monooxygenase HmoA
MTESRVENSGDLYTPAKEHSMFARVTTLQVQPGKMDDGIRVYASLAPQLQSVKGFISTQLLIDRTANTALVVTLYETLADIEAGATLFQQSLANSGAEALLAGPTAFTVYEVALQVAAQP